jgi:hypothetical protein
MKKGKEGDMLGQLTTEPRIHELEPLKGTSPKGFVERAKALLGISTPGPAPVSPGSRRDFLQALQLLGARCYRCRLGPRDPIPRTISIQISCPYQTWLKVFGPPRGLEKHSISSTGVAIHTWKHDCKDGTITCIGQLSERLPGLRWVVVMRLGMYG